MGLPQLKETRYTYADYRQWPEGERYELIDGEAWAMGPAPSRRHQEVIGEIFRQIADALDGTPCRPYIAPFDVRLPQANETDDEIDTVVQPDISVICDKTKLDEQGCRGAPDWIVEVLSPASVGRDQIIKRALYERVGVREYWIVHPTDRVVTIYLLENGAYGKPAIHELMGATAATILPRVVIDWARVMRD
ncbi:MAG: Uma2 family endonuclease [Rhodocyclaceae bacterium]|jgi:Uma2 family endonuclease|nr:Uma2 family endonuclease [Rhodocyclaceae bacterium]